MQDLQGILLGPTSIVGYAIARQGIAGLTPWANEHNRARPAKRWPRVALSEIDQVRAMMRREAPRVVIHCDAVCDVPKCEADPDWARSINVGCLQNVLAAMPRGCRLLYVSSDHVFGGDGAYDEDSTPCPISAYGRSRVEAEALAAGWSDALIVRAGLPLGASIDGRSGHWDWLRHRHRKKLPITIIEDESRSVVWAEDLARRIVGLAVSNVRGLRHVPATRALDRPTLARDAARRLALDIPFRFESRRQQGHPHMGRVTLSSKHRDAWSEPLASPLDEPDRMPAGRGAHQAVAQ